MIFQTDAKVIKNFEIVPNYYKIVLDAPRIAKQAQPGQFVNIRVSDKYNPFLRRPFSIHNIEDKKIVVLYKIVGKATEILSQKKTGNRLDILGPLGNGFDFNSKPMQNAILVTGGMGVAPLIFLAEKLVHSHQSTVNRKDTQFPYSLFSHLLTVNCLLFSSLIPSHPHHFF